MMLDQLRRPERRPEKEFETPNGPVKVKLFEGGAGWNSFGVGEDWIPHIFVWGVYSRHVKKLNLPEMEGMDLNQAYFGWIADEGCGNCPLRESEVCSGLEPKQSQHFVEGTGFVDSPQYETHINPGAVRDKRYDEVKTMIKKQGTCRAKQHG